jgi:hypothetical protein
MHARAKLIILTTIAALVLAGCTTPTATHGDCNGGVETGTGNSC